MSLRNKTCFSLIGCSLSFLVACNNSTNSGTEAPLQVKGAMAPAPLADTATNASLVDTTENVSKPLAMLTTPKYEVTVHKAISFEPGLEGVEFFRLKEGHRYVVLDMALKITAGREVDMGQVLLSATLRDEKGREYRHESKAVAAYTLNNADPQHQAQYNTVWGKMKPGQECRATIMGLAIPQTVKKLTLSMGDDGDNPRNTKRHETVFSIE